MAPRSPTQAFDPTPALEQNSDNYSPLNHKSAMLSFETPFHHGSSKEVRFTDPPVNTYQHRAHSIATENVPLLQQVSSASRIPRQAFHITNPTPGLSIDINAYIENCRNLNEQLRTAHETERRAWNIERASLKAKIADLEFQLNKSKDSKRRSSNDSVAAATANAFRSDFRSTYNNSAIGGNKSVSDTVVPQVRSSSGPPVWQGPEHHAPTTRVFSNEDTITSSASNHLPAISEDGEGFPDLAKEISPTSHPLVPVESISVPVGEVDRTLDGITLKSTGLTSSFVTKITSPQFGSPVRSPSPKQVKTENGALRIDSSTLLSALDEKLKRHAGHTPMAFDAEPSIGASNVTTEIPTPVMEQPHEPAPTKRPPLRPSENSDSYFSFASDSNMAEEIKARKQREEAAATAIGEEVQFETSDDKPLKGPLMLDPSARTQAANAFLEKLDAKLEAVKNESTETSPERRRVSIANDAGSAAPATEPSTNGQSDGNDKEQDDDMPKLRLKKSMNFGSAYGSNAPGWR